MKITLAATIARNEEKFLSNPVGDELVLLDLTTGDYIALNAVAARIWEWLKEPQTVQQLLDLLSSEYDVSSAECLEDTISFLEEIQALKMLSNI